MNTPHFVTGLNFGQLILGDLSRALARVRGCPAGNRAQ